MSKKYNQTLSEIQTSLMHFGYTVNPKTEFEVAAKHAYLFTLEKELSFTQKYANFLEEVKKTSSTFEKQVVPHDNLDMTEKLHIALKLPLYTSYKVVAPEYDKKLASLASIKQKFATFALIFNKTEQGKIDKMTQERSSARNSVMFEQEEIEYLSSHVRSAMFRLSENAEKEINQLSKQKNKGQLEEIKLLSKVLKEKNPDLQNQSLSF